MSRAQNQVERASSGVQLRQGPRPASSPLHLVYLSLFRQRKIAGLDLLESVSPMKFCGFGSTNTALERWRNCELESLTLANSPGELAQLV